MWLATCPACGQTSAYMKAILNNCSKHSEKYYNLVLLNNFWAETEARYKKGGITKSHYLGKRKCLERLTEYHNAGTLSWTMHKPKQKYRLSGDAQTLLDEFLKTLIRDANTTYDYSWVIRRYLNYLRGIWLCSIPARAITRMNTYFIPNGEGFVRQCQMTMCGSCCGCMLTAHGALVLLYRPICTHTTSATVERCIFTSTAWSLHWFRNGWGMQTWRLL